jgi:hypothetical protein
LVDPRAQPGTQGWGISVIISGEIQKSRATAAWFSVVQPDEAASGSIGRLTAAIASSIILSTVSNRDGIVRRI